ncbi:chromate transporter [Niallia circulans]
MKDVSNTLALAGTAPGAIAVNSSIFIGYKVSGIAGAIVAMIGAIHPTIVIVLGSLYFYFQVMYMWMQHLRE